MVWRHTSSVRMFLLRILTLFIWATNVQYYIDDEDRVKAINVGQARLRVKGHFYFDRL